VAKQFLKIDGLRPLERRLWNDERLRTICDLEEDEPAYGRTVLSRFSQRLGVRTLKRIITQLIKTFFRRGVVKAEVVAFDATFIN
jgi:hypothetical protein